jgi:hypothetical protein
MVALSPELILQSLKEIVHTVADHVFQVIAN